MSTKVVPDTSPDSVPSSSNLAPDGLQGIKSVVEALLVQKEPIFLRGLENSDFLVLLPIKVLPNGMLFCESSRKGSKAIYLVSPRTNGSYSVYRKGSSPDSRAEPKGEYHYLNKDSRIRYFIDHITSGSRITLLLQGKLEEFYVEQVYTNGDYKRLILYKDNKRAEINFKPRDIRIHMGEEVSYNLIDTDNGQVSQEEAAYFISRD